MTVHAARAAGVRGPLGLVLAAALGLTGCGPDLDTPEGTTRAFVEAMAERDWDGACDLLSHDFVHRATEGSSQYCGVHLEQRHPDTSRYGTLAVQGKAVETADGYRLEVAPENAPEQTEEVVVVEESGRLVLLGYPGRDTAVR
ncbi:hypothetical protein [Kocuria aegyptia]|uniref:Nuclear transport factor 2 family protein n=1 Tax=Kocuria aegyptia TaxID=330943 RepID=A0ABP4WRB2_9MICC